MLVLRFSDAYTITPGPGDVTSGTIGLWFTAAGTVTVLTKLGKTVTVGGAIGSCFECPIQKVTAAGGGAAVLGLLGR